MTELQIKQLAFLTETMGHYTLKNRAFNPKKEQAQCTYVPIPGVSDGCAIGRHVPDKALCAEFDEIGSVCNQKVFNRLPVELQELGVVFLSAIQSLHDGAKYWGENGLIEEGYDKVGEIKRKFGLVV